MARLTWRKDGNVPHNHNHDGIDEVVCETSTFGVCSADTRPSFLIDIYAQNDIPISSDERTNASTDKRTFCTSATRSFVIAVSVDVSVTLRVCVSLNAKHLSLSLASACLLRKRSSRLPPSRMRRTLRVRFRLLLRSLLLPTKRVFRQRGSRLRHSSLQRYQLLRLKTIRTVQVSVPCFFGVRGACQFNGAEVLVCSNKG